jgi:DNA repair and recombination protein RAD52
MTFTKEQIETLAGPLDPKHVASRQQGGGQVQYIEGWHAIAEANRIFGFDGWNRETLEMVQLGEPYENNGKMRVNYRAKVLIMVLDENGIGKVRREGCGFGQGIDRDLGQAHESAIKEAETDAMKRAFMTFGNPFGLALYDKTRANVQAPAPDLSDDDQKMRRAIADCHSAEDLSAWSALFGEKAAASPNAKLIRQAYKRRMEEINTPQQKAA